MNLLKKTYFCMLTTEALPGLTGKGFVVFLWCGTIDLNVWL